MGERGCGRKKDGGQAGENSLVQREAEDKELAVPPAATQA